MKDRITGRSGGMLSGSPAVRMHWLGKRNPGCPDICGVILQHVMRKVGSSVPQRQAHHFVLWAPLGLLCRPLRAHSGKEWPGLLPDLAQRPVGHRVGCLNAWDTALVLQRLSLVVKGQEAKITRREAEQKSSYVREQEQLPAAGRGRPASAITACQALICTGQ